MRAMVLPEPGVALEMRECPLPEPGKGEVRIKVETCGACRTDVHIADEELPAPGEPRILGHQVVGRVDAAGEAAGAFPPGTKVGVPWLGKTCGRCRFCRQGRENLCVDPVFTGYSRDGGFAEYLVADEAFCFELPEEMDSVTLAPLLCAGLIGYRSYRKTGDAERLGLYGFGSAAHILAQVATADGKKVYAFTRPGDEDGQQFARDLGVEWSGGSDEAPPDPLHAAIIFAPVGPLVVEALQQIDKGAPVVCAGIHMSEIPSFPYRFLWEERRIESVANLTREDGRSFFDRVGEVDIHATTTSFPLKDANEALDAIRNGSLNGSAVLTIEE